MSEFDKIINQKGFNVPSKFELFMAKAFGKISIHIDNESGISIKVSRYKGNKYILDIMSDGVINIS